jgi:cellulose synthase/poly-beta-1,6-N-acetylglucosamine synthase-like glycosyltransferase
MGQNRADVGRVSVVIPTLNEAGQIGPLIESLRRERELREIIVADGGSTDDTASIAERLGTRLVTSDRGRGQQLRAGAAAARSHCSRHYRGTSEALQGHWRSPGGQGAPGWFKTSGASATAFSRTARSFGPW